MFGPFFLIVFLRFLYIFVLPFCRFIFCSLSSFSDMSYLRLVCYFHPVRLAFQFDFTSLCRLYAMQFCLTVCGPRERDGTWYLSRMMKSRHGHWGELDNDVGAKNGCVLKNAYEVVHAYHPKFRQRRMPHAIAARMPHIKDHADRHEQWKRVT